MTKRIDRPRKTGAMFARSGASNGRWNGGRRVTAKGYVAVHMPSHPRAERTGCVKEHILVAERLIGRPLAKGEVVHHINRDKGDNRPENLLVLPSQSAHAILHREEDALAACGDRMARKCSFCHQYDALSALVIYEGRTSVFHRACYNAAQCVQRAARRALSTTAKAS